MKNQFEKISLKKTHPKNMSVGEKVFERFYVFLLVVKIPKNIYVEEFIFSNVAS